MPPPPAIQSSFIHVCCWTGLVAAVHQGGLWYKFINLYCGVWLLRAWLMWGSVYFHGLFLLLNLEKSVILLKRKVFWTRWPRAKKEKALSKCTRCGSDYQGKSLSHSWTIFCHKAVKPYRHNLMIPGQLKSNSLRKFTRLQAFVLYWCLCSWHHWPPSKN